MAAVTANIQSMIDHLCGRFGNDDAESRALILGWLQRVEEWVWGRSDWWFRVVERAQAWTPAQVVYEVADAQRILEVREGTGIPLERVSAVIFGRTFRPYTSNSGIPLVWAECVQLEEDLVNRFEVWPIPTAETVAGSVVVSLAVATLADTAESVSGIPADWREILLVGVEELIAEHYQQLGTVQLLQAKKAELLQALIQEDQKRGVLG